MTELIQPLFVRLLYYVVTVAKATGLQRRVVYDLMVVNDKTVMMWRTAVEIYFQVQYSTNNCPRTTYQYPVLHRVA
jgi:hypothetical protein